MDLITSALLCVDLAARDGLIIASTGTLIAEVVFERFLIHTTV